MKNTILSLWNGGLNPCSQQEVNRTQVVEAVRMLEAHKSKLEKQLTDEEKALLEELDGKYASLSSLECENAFVRGFSLGVRIMADALSVE